MITPGHEAPLLAGEADVVDGGDDEDEEQGEGHIGGVQLQ